MSCYEEVFEISIDQNGNLNGRIKETEHINELFDSLKEHFELCHQELNKEVDKLRPILENYLKNSKISFTELEQNSTPNQLKELLSEFHEKEKIVKKIKPIVNIGIFEFQLDDLLDMVSDAPRQWIEKMNKVIPNVLTDKMKSSIERMSKHLIELSVNPSDVESFIKLKKAVEAEFTEHNGDITVEIAHQHHRKVLVFERPKDSPALSRYGSGSLIEVVGHCPPVTLTIHSKELHLQTDLRLQCCPEGIIGLDDGLTPQHPLHIDIGFTVLCLGDGHPMALIGMPDGHSPVLSARIERAAVVEDVAPRHDFRYLTNMSSHSRS